MLKRLLVVLLFIASVLVAAPTAQAAPPIVSGTLVDSGGRPVSGATVSLWLFDDRGQPSWSPPIEGSTTSNGLGSFALTAFYTPEDDAAAQANGGWDNFDLMASTPGQFFTTSFPRRYDGTSWQDPDGATDIGTLRPSMVDPNAPSAANNCGYVPLVLGTATSWTKIGELHFWYDTSGWFKYSYNNGGADSTIDVGYSNNNVSFSVNGSGHVGNSGSEVGWTPSGKWSNIVDTEFTYRDFKYVPNCGGNPYYKVKPYHFIGGTSTGGGTSSLDGQCGTTYTKATPYDPGTYLLKWDNQAYKFGAAFSAFGFSVGGAFSGYSTKVEAKWNFGNVYSTYWLCGPNTYPTTSERVFAGPNQ